MYLHISTAFVARRIPAPTSLSLSAPPSHAKVFSKQNRPLSWARPLPARSFRVRRDTLLYSTLLYIYIYKGRLRLDETVISPHFARVGGGGLSLAISPSRALKKWRIATLRSPAPRARPEHTQSWLDRAGDTHRT